MSLRIMRDSTTLADDPQAGTDIIAAYINGLYATSAAQVAARFPAVPVCWIDVLGALPGADVLDVETGDATVAGAVTWARAKLAMKPAYPPVIYCNRVTLTPLFNAMNAAGLHVVTHFRLWVATLDGTKTLPDMTGVTAVQYAGQPQTGHHYDESIVYDPAWKASAAPKPAPPPVVVAEGYLVTRGTLGGALAGRAVTSHDGGKTWA
jgi:hypothetical protein